MSEPKQETINAIGGNLIVTERKIKHQKSGEMQDYLSFSNGQDVCGIFLGKNTKKELSKFLNKKDKKTDDNNDDNNNEGNDDGTSNGNE